MTLLENGPVTDYETNVTQGWGDNDGHLGVDFSKNFGAPIFATHDGRIRVSTFQETGFGEVIVVEAPGKEYETTYAHMSERRYEAGDSVQAGDVIGLVGSTGNSTGAHLHFGIRVAPWDSYDGNHGYTNPEPYLAALTMEKPMNIYQIMLSNLPEHYQAPTGLEAFKQNIVEIPLEQIETISNNDGECFAPDCVTSRDWLKGEGKEVWSYFNAAKPRDKYEPTNLPHERDAYWFRREHSVFINNNGMVVNEIYTDPRSQKYKDYIVPKILATGARAINFDNATLDSSSVSWAVEDWFKIYDVLRGEGVKVIGNGLWQKDYAMAHSDGFLCELWTGNRPHYIKPNGQWGALTEMEFGEISKRWVAAGKLAVMLVRWRPNESVFSQYEDFCLHYMELADSCGGNSLFLPYTTIIEVAG